jgi:hypothetical protein
MQTSHVDIVSTGESTITTGGINVSQLSTVNSACLQSPVNDAQIRKDIQRNLDNVAYQYAGSMLSQQQGLQIQQAIVDISTRINLEMVKSCLGSILQANIVNLRATNGSVLVTDNILLEQIASSATKCVQNDEVVAKATDRIQRAIMPNGSSNPALNFGSDNKKVMIAAAVGLVILILILAISFT